MSLPFVSCVCPTYGRTNLLEEAIESFLRQDYQGPSELVICNDLINQTIYFKHPRVKVRNLDERCHTLGDKRNVTASMASGDYLMTWGDDDIHLPGRISRMVKWMQQNNIRFGLEGKHYCWEGESLKENSFSTGGAHMVERSLYWEIGGIPSINSGEDVAFNDLVKSKLGIDSLPQCMVTPQFIYRWNSPRSHVSALSQSGDPEDGYSKMVVHVNRYLQSGSEPSGSVSLVPKWTRDWIGIAPKKPLSLTIGMATYDDYDGVYFTIQAIRMYQNLPENTEFIVIDNNPGSRHSNALNGLAKGVKGLKVIPIDDRKSSFVKYDLFKYAANDIVLGLDCHVLLETGFIDSLMEFWSKNQGSKSLLSGPVLMNDKISVSTHMDQKWRTHDFGTWGTNHEGMKNEVPFEIPMQGMGCYSVWRESWPGVNPHFKGFGGEEWYVSQKIKQAGGNVLCHPKMKWMHRFDWPVRTFPLSLEDKIINYYRGWLELYGDENHPMIKEMTDYWLMGDKPVPESIVKSCIAKAKIPT